MKNLVTTIAIILAFCLNIQAREIMGDEDYGKYTFVDSVKGDMPYRMLMPKDIKLAEKYPLVLFLHGHGERGDDNTKQLKHGSLLFSNPANEDTYPAFVVFPQCDGVAWTAPYDERTFLPGAPIPDESNEEKILMSLLDDLIANYPIDVNRIYIMGISMGAIGTYDLVVRYPERFAAAIPICGAINPERLSVAKDVPFYIFQGADDRIVPILAGRDAYVALREAGANVKYREYYGADHEQTWIDAFNNPNLLEWLFSQNKTKIK